MTKMLKKQNGYVLMSSMGLAVLMILIGGTSIYMVQTGAETNKAERNYQIAKYASDYALNTAIKRVIDSSLKNPCGIEATSPSIPEPTGYTLNDTTMPNNSKGTYSFTTQSDGSNLNCMIIAYGKYNGSRVVKSAIIPVKLEPAKAGAMTTNGFSDLTITGDSSLDKAAIASGCGPGVVYKNTSSYITQLETGNEVNATIKTQQNTSANFFDTAFNGSVSDWNSAKSAINTFINARADSVSGTNCEVMPTDAQISSVSCTSSGTNITCSGGSFGTKTINTSSCPEVVIKANTIDITSAIPSVLTINSLTRTKVDIPVGAHAETKGFITSNGTLDLVPKSGAGLDNLLNGIFIGGNAPSTSGLLLNGNKNMMGLYFLGNQTTPLDLELKGTDKIEGALIVNGDINLTRAGGGSASPNIEFKPEKIDYWRGYYNTNNILDALTCSGPPPSKKGMSEKTKMSLF